MRASPRTRNRAAALGAAALRSISRRRLRERPAKPGKLLVLHELLLGDTVMLAPLLAALRERYPRAELYVTAKPAYASLFEKRPYGARVLPFSMREPRALKRLAAARDADIVFLPGENRFAVLARALGAKWVVGLAGGRSGWRERLLDERIPIPPSPLSVADLFGLLAGGTPPRRYRVGEWPAPECAPFDRPAGRYAVLHAGAGSPLRLWGAEKWRAVADALQARGISPVWSAGRGEGDVVSEIDPRGRYASYAGRLDLAQLWHLIAGAQCVITLDTGVAHLAKLTGAPTAALYGPGSPVLFGRGEFWRDAEYAELGPAEFPCRDQQTLFRREVPWVRRCQRTLAECPRARCMESIEAAEVVSAIE